MRAATPWTSYWTLSRNLRGAAWFFQAHPLNSSYNPGYAMANAVSPLSLGINHDRLGIGAAKLAALRHASRKSASEETTRSLAAARKTEEC